MEIIIGAVVLVVVLIGFAGLCGSARRTAISTRAINRKLADFQDAMTPEAKDRIKQARDRKLRGGTSSDRWERLKAK